MRAGAELEIDYLCFKSEQEGINIYFKWILGRDRGRGEGVLDTCSFEFLDATSE